MTVNQLIRQLGDFPGLKRVHVEGNDLIIGGKTGWIIPMDTKLDREISEMYEDRAGVKRD